MSNHRINVESVLRSDEERRLREFCRRGAPSLPELAAFLATEFGVELATDPDIVAGFIADSSNLPGHAGGVCRPKSERECAILLLAAHAAGIPLTVLGGRSNLTGSATPAGGIALSTVNMLSTPALDADRRLIRAPIGMILEDLRKEVLRLSSQTLAFPVDPTSRADATVGGAIACNASGFVPGEAGAIRAWVAALDFLLPDGTVIRASRGDFISRDGEFTLVRDGRETRLPVPRYARPAVKNASGPYSAPDGVMDFVDLLIGSEGIFGLVSGCTLRLAPRPADALDLFLSLPGEDNAVRLRNHLEARLAGGLGTLSALEYFGPNCRRFMDHESALFRGTDAVGVYIQVPLADGDAAAAADEWLEILMESDCGVNGDSILLLDNDRDRALFMEARHSLPANSLEVVQHRGTYTLMTDTVVPAPRFQEFLRYTHDLLAARRLDYLVFGHLGDCHLHFMILPEKELLADATAVYEQIVAHSAALGGVYSGEHGTGKRKRGDFLRCYGPAGVEQVRQCKAALDPAFLLNRGNVVEPPA